MKISFFARKTGLIRQKVKSSWQSFNQWFFYTPERAITEAYQAAQKIRNIELEYFDNQKISPESGRYTATVMSYWQGELEQHLASIKLRLAEFNLSISLLHNSDAALLEKLNFIDEVINRYTQIYTEVNYTESLKNNQPNANKKDFTSNDVTTTGSSPRKMGVLPGSLGRTFNHITENLAPQAEESFVRNYRISRNRTRSAIRFLLILIIVPLLTQHFSKQLLINPIVERMRSEDTSKIFLNAEMETEAFKELRIFEKSLHFKNLLRQAPTLSADSIEEQVKDKALEIAAEFRNKTNGALSNVIADLISLVAFAVIIAMSRKEIAIVQSFMDKIVYGLSDSAKAFLIILFTDIFVGFHSPHGWEILLEGLAEHLGIPASRSAIFLFIATFPVILNTIFKYWIFRYLSRLSPSALATLKEMDE
jgi:hypothetical protein